MEKDPKAIIFMILALLSGVFIILTGPLFVLKNITFLLVQIFGLLLIFWAILARMLNKHHTKYNLPPGYYFIKAGPYEILRHPIYAGLLLIMSSTVQNDFVFFRAVALFIFLIALLLKIIREEFTMEQHIKEYGEYKSKTKRLIPYLF